MLRLDRLQKLFAYLTVAFALGAMAGAGALEGFALIAVPVAVLVSWFWDPDRFDLHRQRIVWNLVLVGFILWTAWVVSVGSKPVLRPAVDLVLVLAVAKLYQRQTARDYSQIYALSFLMVAVATVLNDGLGFAVFFVGFLLSAGVGFSLCHLLRLVESEDAEPMEISRRTVAMLGGMAGLLVVLAAGFFLLLPRVGIGMGSGAPRSSATQMTGFSDTIDLGDHGALGLDETVVMRVAMDGPVAQPYWRGMSFDYFDGIAWTAAPPLRRRRSVPMEGDQFVLADRPQTDLVEQQIELEPINADVLIGLTMPSQLHYDADNRSSESWRNVSVDRSGDLHHSFGHRQPVAYTVESHLTDRSAITETDERIPDDIRRFYLSVPHGLSGRTRRLAHQIVGDEHSPLAMATAIESYLQNNYQYTLDLPARGANPIDNFLFEDRRGHCEFFSTSMAMLLREVGIPARNVNGFQGGEWNDVGGYYVVRRLNAHSWVEAWIPGAGWVTFDPTPPAGLPASRAEGGSGFFSRMGEYLDALRRTWRDWVLNYDFQRQLDLFGDSGDGSTLDESLTTAARTMVSNWLGWLLLCALFILHAVLVKRSRRPGMLTLAVMVTAQLVVYLVFIQFSVLAFILAFVVPGWLLWQLRIAADRVGIGAPRSPLGRLRQSIVELAMRHPGFAGSDTDGPLRLAEQVQHLGGDWDQAAQLLREYARVRFGPDEVSDENVNDMVRKWRALRSSLRSENRRAAQRARRLDGAPG